MSDKEPSKREPWTPRGVGCGCLSAIAVVVMTSPLLFAVTWNCAHRSAELEPCSIWQGRLAFLGMLALAAVTFWLVGRSENRANTDTDPE